MSRLRAVWLDNQALVVLVSVVLVLSAVQTFWSGR